MGNELSGAKYIFVASIFETNQWMLDNTTSIHLSLSNSSLTGVEGMGT